MQTEIIRSRDGYLIKNEMVRYGIGANEMVQYFNGTDIYNYFIWLLPYKFLSCLGSWTISNRDGDRWEFYGSVRFSVLLLRFGFITVS